MCFFTFGNELFAQQEQLSIHGESTQEGKDSTYYFPNALVYEYQLDSMKEEFWIYVNPETSQLLFVPNDDMIDAVISFPDGTYQIFGKTEARKDTILIQCVSEVADENLELLPLQPTGDSISISQQHIQQPDILCTGYEIRYEKMDGGEIIYTTSQLDINSRQIYGFCRLDGDARLKVFIDYLAVLPANQLLTHVQSNGFSLKLLDYGSNPYYFTTKIN